MLGERRGRTHESEDIAPVIKSWANGAGEVCGIHAENTSKEGQGEKNYSHDSE
jgi:hypothetical protein